MHGKTSSAPHRADGRGALITPGTSNDSRPFRCVPLLMRGTRRHRWRLVDPKSPVINLAHRGGHFLFEYCARRGCAAQRLTPANTPGGSS